MDGQAMVYQVYVQSRQTIKCSENQKTVLLPVSYFHTICFGFLFFFFSLLFFFFPFLFLWTDFSKSTHLIPFLKSSDRIYKRKSLKDYLDMTLFHTGITSYILVLKDKVYKKICFQWTNLSKVVGIFFNK